MSKGANNKRRIPKRRIIKLEDKAARLGLSRSQYVLIRGRNNLRRFVDGGFFNLVIAFLILISVCLIFAEFLLPPSPLQQSVENSNDILTWIFIVELSLRFVVAPNKRIFFSNYWIDILAVLPALRIFRTFRVLRLLRILRLFRAGMIVMQQSGWLSSKFEWFFGSFGMLIVTALMFILCGTLAMLTFERPTYVGIDSFLESIWTTTFLFISGEMVGNEPMTPMGKFIAALISTSGLVVFAVLVGTVSAAMANYLRTKMESKDITLDDLRGHTIICGWDRKGSIILSELEAVPNVWGRGVVVIAETDEDIERDKHVKNNRVLFHIRDDFTKIEVLESAGGRRAQTAIVLADKGRGLRDQDRDARTVLSALTLEKLNPEIYTVCELLHEQNAEHLRLAGVEEIITRTSLTAGLFAASAVHEGITPVITDILTHHEGSHFKKIPIPEEFVGHEFMEAYDYFKRELEATVIGIDQKNERGVYEQHVNPPHTEVMAEDDRLILILKLESAISELG